MRSIELFEKARSLFLQKRFLEARELIEVYRKIVRYEDIARHDHRDGGAVSATAVVVSFKTGPALFDCLDSLLNQNRRDFEIILVDNGGNQELLSRLAHYPLLHVFSAANLLPSEGRNIGAHFARSGNLLFLDDDSLIHPSFVDNAIQALKDRDLPVLRGRVLPKSSGQAANMPFHYDLGPYPLPAVLSTEGNMAVQKDVFDRVGGFDPLLFGCEGIELNHRCIINFPGRYVSYCPGMVIYHDFASGDRLQAKKKRQALTGAYLKRLYPGANLLLHSYVNWYRSRPAESIKITLKVIGEAIKSPMSRKRLLFSRLTRLISESCRL
ncbi:MAG: glycosyltransferase [Desulfatiglandaceae bacterium]